MHNNKINDLSIEEILLAYLKDNKNISMDILSKSLDDSCSTGEVILRFKFTDKWLNSTLFQGLKYFRD